MASHGEEDSTRFPVPTDLDPLLRNGAASITDSDFLHGKESLELPSGTCTDPLRETAYSSSVNLLDCSTAYNMLLCSSSDNMTSTKEEQLDAAEVARKDEQPVHDGVPGVAGKDGHPVHDGVPGVAGKDGHPVHDGVPGVAGKDGHPVHDGIPGVANEDSVSFVLGDHMIFCDLNALPALEPVTAESDYLLTSCNHPFHSASNGLPEYQASGPDPNLIIQNPIADDDCSEEAIDEELNMEHFRSSLKTVCDTKVKSISYAWQDSASDSSGTWSQIEHNSVYRMEVKGTILIDVNESQRKPEVNAGACRKTPNAKEHSACSTSSPACKAAASSAGKPGNSTCCISTHTDVLNNRTHLFSDEDYEGYSGHHPSYFRADNCDYLDIDGEVSDEGSDGNDGSSTSHTNCDTQLSGASHHDSGLKCSFSDLPAEIVQKIFQYMSQSELGLTVALVCKAWRDYAYDPIHWKELVLGYEQNFGVETIYYCLQRAPFVTHINLCWQRHISLGLLKAIGKQCVMLKELDLGFCGCVNYTFLSCLSTNLKMLESVNLEGCQDVDLRCMEAISRMAKLRRLNLSHCTLLDDDAVKLLANNLATIQALNIDGIPTVTDEAITALVSLHGPSLEQLDLDGAELTDTSIHALLSCLQLRGLAISFAELLTDTALACIKTMKSLQRLQIKKGADLTTSGLLGLFKAKTLTNLTKLNLAEATKLSDEGVMALVECCGVRLTSLSLCWCWNVTDVGLAAIVDHCKLLEHLDLLGLDKITGSCLRRLPHVMVGLRTLNLQQCNMIIDELIISVVRRMPKLKATNYYGEEFRLVQELTPDILSKT